MIYGGENLICTTRLVAFVVGGQGKEWNGLTIYLSVEFSHFEVEQKRRFNFATFCANSGAGNAKPWQRNCKSVQIKQYQRLAKWHS